MKKDTLWYMVLTAYCNTKNKFAYQRLFKLFVIKCYLVPIKELSLMVCYVVFVIVVETTAVYASEIVCDRATIGGRNSCLCMRNWFQPSNI